jgi:hypothetical protein
MPKPESTQLVPLLQCRHTNILRDRTRQQSEVEQTTCPFASFGSELRKAVLPFDAAAVRKPKQRPVDAANPS